MTALLDFIECAAVIMAGAILGLLGLAVILALLFIIGYLYREVYAFIKKGGRR